MAQHVYPLVSAGDRARLEAIVADRNRVQKHVMRARIILGAAERLSVTETARRAGAGRHPRLQIDVAEQRSRTTVRPAHPAFRLPPITHLDQTTPRRPRRASSSTAC